MLCKKITVVLRNLTLNKKRSFFAMLGVAIGVAAVVSLLSFGQGTHLAVLNEIEKMGANLILVSPARLDERRPGRGGEMAKTLTAEDAEKLEGLEIINQAVPVQRESLEVKYKTRKANTSVIGTLPSYQQVRNFRIQSGRFFQEIEVTGNQRVAVLGSAVAEDLFRNLDPVGENIRINNVLFTVVGVLEEKGADITGEDQDDCIFIPLSTASRRVLNREYLDNIYLQVESSDQMEAAKEAAATLLAELHNIAEGDNPDFILLDQGEVITARGEIDETFTLLLSAVAVVSLLIGAIGILAVMLMAIRERTWEIGLRRAVGAKRKDILGQFILEALILGLSGGLLGIAGGVASSLLASYFAGWPTAFSLQIIALAIIFSSGVGLAAGIYPALKASKLTPMEALRAE